MREAEAMFRDDSLVIPVATSTKTTISRGVWFSGYIYKRSCPEKARLRIVYRAHIYARGKQLKQLARPTRSEAMAAMLQYQMQHTI